MVFGNATNHYLLWGHEAADHEERLWSQSKKTEVEPIHPGFQSTVCKMGILFALPNTIVQIKRRDYIKALCKV